MNPSRTVILGMTIAGVVFVSAYGLQFATTEQGKRIKNPLPALGGIEMFVAWGVLFLFLIIMAEIPATGDLASAFTWLIVLAMLFSYGPAAFQNLMALMKPGPRKSGFQEEA